MFTMPWILDPCITYSLLSPLSFDLNTFFNVKNFKIFLSISDEKKYSIANVIISKKWILTKKK